MYPFSRKLILKYILVLSLAFLPLQVYAAEKTFGQSLKCFFSSIVFFIDAPEYCLELPESTVASAPAVQVPTPAPYGERTTTTSTNTVTERVIVQKEPTITYVQGDTVVSSGITREELQSSLFGLKKEILSMLPPSTVNYVSSPSAPAYSIAYGVASKGYVDDSIAAVSSTLGTRIDSLVMNASSSWQQNGSALYYNGGNVGIGTSVPEFKLSVSEIGAGTLSAPTNISLWPNITAGNPILYINGWDSVSNQLTTGRLEMHDYAAGVNNFVMGASGDDNIRLQVDGGGSNTHIGFNLGNTDYSAVVVRRNVSGNAFIGIRGPSSEAGSLAFESRLTASDTGLNISTVAGGITMAPNNNTVFLATHPGSGIVNALRIGNTAENFYHTIQSGISSTATTSNFLALNISGASAGSQTEVMRLSGTGNVGIGTTSPSQKLDVWGNFQVGTSSVSSLFVDTALNKVGIGTTTLATGRSLTVAGTGLQIYRSGGATPHIELVQGGAGTDLGKWRIGANNDGVFQISPFTDGGSNIGMGLRYTHDNRLIISTVASPISIDAKLIVDSGSSASTSAVFLSGNVGIGTTTPATTLTIASTTAAGAYFEAIRIATNNNTSFGNYMFFARAGTTTRGLVIGEQYNANLLTPTIRTAGGFSQDLEIRAGRNDVGNGGFVYFNTGGNGTSRIFMGTTTVITHFDVYGTATASNFIATSSGAISSFAGSVSIGTSTPSAQLTNTGTVRFAALGSGGANLITDSLGNVTVSSDERLKDIQGNYVSGLEQIKGITPITYKWKPETGYDSTNSYAGFSAQNIQSMIPEAVTTDTRGFLTLADRPILATLVNAVKELAGKVEPVLVWFKDGKLNIQNDVCVDEVCISKQEFKDMILRNKALGPYQSPEPSHPTPAEPTPIITEPASEDVEVIIESPAVEEPIVQPEIIEEESTE